MEEKKVDIKNYLRNVVSPFLSPLMEAMIRDRPHDLALFTQTFINNLICKSVFISRTKSKARGFRFR